MDVSRGVQQDGEQGHVVQTAHDCHDLLVMLFKKNPIFKIPNFPWNNPENWRVKDDVRRLTYNLLRCPGKLLDMLGQMYECTKPEIAGLML